MGDETGGAGETKRVRETEEVKADLGLMDECVFR